MNRQGIGRLLHSRGFGCALVIVLLLFVIGLRMAQSDKDVNPYVIGRDARIVKVVLNPLGNEVMVEDEDRRLRTHAPLLAMPAPSNVSIGDDLVGTYDCLSYDLAYAPNGYYFARADKHGLEVRDFRGNGQGWPMWKVPGKFNHIVFDPVSSHLICAEELSNKRQQITVFDAKTGKRVVSRLESPVTIRDITGIPGTSEVGVLRDDG